MLHSETNSPSLRLNKNENIVPVSTFETLFRKKIVHKLRFY